MLGRKKSEVKLSYFPGLYEYRFTEENLTDYEAFVLELIVYLANSAKITKPLLCHLPGFIDFDVYTVITKTQTSKIEYIFFPFILLTWFLTIRAILKYTALYFSVINK